MSLINMYILTPNGPRLTYALLCLAPADRTLSNTDVTRRTQLSAMRPGGRRPSRCNPVESRARIAQEGLPRTLALTPGTYMSCFLVNQVLMVYF